MIPKTDLKLYYLKFSMFREPGISRSLSRRMVYGSLKDNLRQASNVILHKSTALHIQRQMILIPGLSAIRNFKDEKCLKNYWITKSLEE